MLHPSYSDLMDLANENVIEGEELLVKSRYSIVIATAKRARQLIDGEKQLVNTPSKKPLSVAVEEMHKGKVAITTGE
jgi:DNA-directed RNA polymerase subunit omega